ncbi:MAG: DUF488 domain-containing protein [Gammaproteobacteria bacterium]|nr:DUF488 domain-containing protein [Gammaproteobacteria bacterium]NIR84934.1 DUF488 domain-containing protein [Gammaproteobacteria bacterium]NIR91783.1 DUF488 domain-containing protein [Gammaproteobacteria bacterium]NIU05981.1 DUF488 domain-containing protein [Gammaproteobacteria bacterium]NIV53028.1 DUF488 family protein [Gammaproteobacteria bacterium]
MTVKVKRIYDPSGRGGGLRVLVDRVWPRGLSKEAAGVDLWLRDIAPSSELRRWFGHDPQKWPEFETRYWRELDENPQPVNVLVEKASRGNVCLLFSAKDTEHNNAVALKEYLEDRFDL